MKKTKKILASALLLSAMVIPTISQARDIQTLYFRVPSYRSVAYTPYAQKAKTAGTSIMNIKDIEGGSYALDGLLVNSGDSQRSDYTTGMMQGQKNPLNNWNSAEGGFSYRVRCINHDSVDYNALITGTWSPDSQ